MAKSDTSQIVSLSNGETARKVKAASEVVSEASCFAQDFPSFRANAQF